MGFGDPGTTTIPSPRNWWTNKDLNLEPFGYEPNALTVVLLVHMVLRVRVELTTIRASTERSTI